MAAGPVAMEKTRVLTPEAALRHAQEALSAFPAAPGFKGLLRRAAEGLARVFGIEDVVLARLSGRGQKLTLKPRGIKLPPGSGLVVCPDDAMAGIASALRSLGSAAGERYAELRDGWMRLATPAGDYVVALVDDPTYREGAVVAWRADQSLDRFDAASQPLARGLLDLLVRQLQNEARWYRKLDKTQEMLYVDDLTGLYNTRYFEVALDSELRRAERFGAQFCLLFIDLDGFKPINDQHGHVSGSGVLKQVAEVLRDVVREVDIPIRYGGDEFVVVLLGATSAKGVLAAERIRRQIEQKEFKLEDGGTARLTASIGVAAYPEHGKDRATLLRMADQTMYNSKRNGKNRVTLVSEPVA